MHKRQHFLTPQRYERFLEHDEESRAFLRDNRLQADSDEQEAVFSGKSLKGLALDKLLISYTAGVDIDALPALLEALVAEYEQLQRKMAVYTEQANVAPLNLGDSEEHHECMQVISLCILLGRQDLLERFVTLMDNGGYAEEDTLYEDLLSRVLPDRYDVDTWYQDYATPLVQTIYATSPEQAASRLQGYCEQWYEHFEHASWYDTHGDDISGYVGYWSFEAAAVALLYGIDTRELLHVIFPHDLLAHARSLPAYQGIRWECLGDAEDEQEEDEEELIDEDDEDDSDEDFAYDIKAAGVTLSDAIDAGSIPHLAQALSAYDTVEAILALNLAANQQEEDEAFFDLALALLGWVPGPGHGLKRVLRLVNRDPQKHAEQLYDLLRHVLLNCKLKTSPDALLEESLDAELLRSELAQIIAAVSASATFLALDAQRQALVLSDLEQAGEHLDDLIERIDERLMPWLAVQRNSSAQASGSSARVPAQTSKPQSRRVDNLREHGTFSTHPAASDGGKLSREQINPAATSNWLELSLDDGKLGGVPGAAYKVIFADGSIAEGFLNNLGHTRLEGVPFGPAKVYYGEDPRPYPRQPIKALASSAALIDRDLRSLGFIPAKLDRDDLYAETTGRIAPYCELNALWWEWASARYHGH
ncbi:PoNe immunity protein domain-containing protein [Pseudomonas sp. SORT22]|uniref:PoNe immunity protein domain-containing protein n=1 Tax=Pseudomonas sp. SORT22 TaxID=2813842 RepID=UPI00201B92AA|nr:PoNe immunity protein domain-containing protein [Pseudomonas sp. SORT22]